MDGRAYMGKGDSTMIKIKYLFWKAVLRLFFRIKIWVRNIENYADCKAGMLNLRLNCLEKEE